MAFLGWNPGTEQEIFSLDELVEQFDLSKCSKSGAKFDYLKAAWFNHEYILKTNDAALAPEFNKILKDNGIEEPLERVVQVVGMMKNRVNFIKELWPLCRFFFVAPDSYDEKTVKKRWKPDSAVLMRKLYGVLEDLEDFGLENQEKTVMSWMEQNELHTGNVMNAFRLALVGAGVGPHMFDISAFLGKEETLKRLDKAINVLG